jgi:hypothetical protein
VERRVAEEMTEHLRSIADAHGITLIWTRKGWIHSEAFVDTRADGVPGRGGSAIVPVIRQPADYLIGLHELGHLLDDNARRFLYATDQYEEILCESAAWAWAQENLPHRFLRHIRAKDWDRVGYAWRTYVAGKAWKRQRPSLQRRPSPRGSGRHRATLRELRHRPL